MENDMNVTTATVSEHAETAKVLAEQALPSKYQQFLMFTQTTIKYKLPVRDQ